MLGLGAPGVVDVNKAPLDLGHALELDLQGEAGVVADAQRRVRVHDLFDVVVLVEGREREKERGKGEEEKLSELLNFDSLPRPSPTHENQNMAATHDLDLGEDPLPAVPRPDHVHEHALRVVRRGDRLELRHRLGVGALADDLLDLALEDAGPDREDVERQQDRRGRVGPPVSVGGRVESSFREREGGVRALERREEERGPWNPIEEAGKKNSKMEKLTKLSRRRDRRRARPSWLKRR